MTISELKNYISSKLGDELKCLLPSYWWKRLLNLILDKVEEVEKTSNINLQTALTTINDNFDIDKWSFYYYKEHPELNATRNVSTFFKVYYSLFEDDSTVLKPLYLKYNEDFEGINYYIPITNWSIDSGVSPISNNSLLAIVLKGVDVFLKNSFDVWIYMDGGIELVPLNRATKTMRIWALPLDELSAEQKSENIETYEFFSSGRVAPLVVSILVDGVPVHYPSTFYTYAEDMLGVQYVEFSEDGHSEIIHLYVDKYGYIKR